MADKIWIGRNAQGVAVAAAIRHRGVGGTIKDWRREGLTVQLEDSETGMADFKRAALGSSDSHAPKEG